MIACAHRLHAAAIPCSQCAGSIAIRVDAHDDHALREYQRARRIGGRYRIPHHALDAIRDQFVVGADRARRAR